MKLILLCQLFYTTFLQKIEKNKVHFRSFTCNLIKIKNQAQKLPGLEKINPLLRADFDFFCPGGVFPSFSEVPWPSSPQTAPVTPGDQAGPARR